MKIEIKNRQTGEVQYTCELSAEVAGKSYELQLGFAVKQAIASDCDLSGCDLRGCDLRGSDLRGSDLRGCNLRGSDLSGSDLRDSDLRGSDLSECNLSYCDLIGCNLSGCNLRDSYLSDSNLSYCDLIGCNLSGSDLRDSDLRDTILSGTDLRDTILSGADLRGEGLSACPAKIKDIHKAVYAAASKPGALNMKTWHSCNTTHCRAGWVVTLAGAGGAALEYALGTPAAAAMIYMASDPSLAKIPDFYCSNEAAMADMARLAGVEAQAAALAHKPDAGGEESA